MDVSWDAKVVRWRRKRGSIESEGQGAISWRERKVCARQREDEGERKNRQPDRRIISGIRSNIWAARRERERMHRTAGDRAFKRSSEVWGVSRENAYSHAYILSARCAFTKGLRLRLRPSREQRRVDAMCVPGRAPRFLSLARPFLAKPAEQA